MAMTIQPGPREYLPDPLGMLEEGEVCFRSSTQWQGSGGLWLDALVGGVLVRIHNCLAFPLAADEPSRQPGILARWV